MRVPDDPGDFAEPFVFLRPSRHRQVVDLAQVFDHCGEERVPRRAGQRWPLAEQFDLAFPRQVEYRPRQLVQVQPQQLAFGPSGADCVGVLRQSCAAHRSRSYCHRVSPVALSTASRYDGPSWPARTNSVSHYFICSPGEPYQPVATVPAAFERPCIPPDCVVHRLHMPNMRPPHALSGGCLAALGATRGLTTAVMLRDGMASVLLAWIGQADLDCAKGSRPGPGPIGSVVATRRHDALVLLSNYTPAQNRAFLDWLVETHAPPVHLRTEALDDPTDYGAIHAAALRALDYARKTFGADADLSIHVSPGTPAMQAIWVLLAKTRYPAELLQSHEKTGVRTVSVPFDIAAEYVPALLRDADDKLARLTAGLPPSARKMSATNCSEPCGIAAPTCSAGRSATGWNCPPWLPISLATTLNARSPRRTGTRPGRPSWSACRVTRHSPTG